eukprot:6050436-Pyramimonas_sp.AAC.2
MVRARKLGDSRAVVDTSGQGQDEHWKSLHGGPKDEPAQEGLNIIARGCWEKPDGDCDKGMRRHAAVRRLVRQRYPCEKLLPQAAAR